MKQAADYIYPGSEFMSLGTVCFRTFQNISKYHKYSTSTSNSFLVLTKLDLLFWFKGTYE